MRRVFPALYLTINLACALIVIVVAYQVAALMALEQRSSADGVDGVTFVARTAPAVLVAIVVNLAWVVGAVVNAGWARRSLAFRWLGGAAVLWVATLLSIRFL
jgi:hypothetical protein